MQHHLRERQKGDLDGRRRRREYNGNQIEEDGQTITNGDGKIFTGFSKTEDVGLSQGRICGILTAEIADMG